MPGDSFVSKFWFNSKNGTKFGKSSYEEMNKAVFIYYPAKQLLNIAPWSCTYEAPLGVCNSSMVIRSLTSVDQTDRIFGSTPPHAGLPFGGAVTPGPGFAVGGLGGTNTGDAAGLAPGGSIGCCVGDPWVVVGFGVDPRVGLVWVGRGVGLLVGSPQLL